MRFVPHRHKSHRSHPQSWLDCTSVRQRGIVFPTALYQVQLISCFYLLKSTMRVFNFILPSKSLILLRFFSTGQSSPGSSPLLLPYTDGVSQCSSRHRSWAFFSQGCGIFFPVGPLTCDRLYFFSFFFWLSPAGHWTTSWLQARCCLMGSPYGGVLDCRRRDCFYSEFYWQHQEVNSLTVG